MELSKSICSSAFANVTSSSPLISVILARLVRRYIRQSQTGQIPIRLPNAFAKGRYSGLLDQGADVFHAPRRDAPHQRANGLRIAPVLDALPPGAFRYWDDCQNRRFRLRVADDLRQAQKAFFRNLHFDSPMSPDWCCCGMGQSFRESSQLENWRIQG